MKYLLLVFLCCITISTVVARVSPADGGSSANAPYAGRVALVIGNDTYEDKVHFPSLKVCLNDADSMTAVLKKCGFFVITCKDGNRKTIMDNIDKFVGMLPENDVALVYYSGHGAELGGKNYIIPTDLMNPKGGNEVLKLMFKNSAIDVQETILSAFGKRPEKINFFIMDACRLSIDDGHPGSKSVKTDAELVTKADAQPGTAIVFATGERQKSYESKGNNSVFTNELLRHISIPNLNYRDVFVNAAAGTEDLVSQYPNDYVGLQQPQILDKINKKFSFVVDETKKAQPEEIRSLSMPAFVVKSSIKENAVLTRFQKADLTYGYEDDENKVAIPAKFDFADEEFHDGLAFVQIGKKFGFIDHQGNLAIPCQFDKASSFSEGRALVYKDGKYGYIDKNGAMAIALQFSSAGSFSEGLAVVKSNDKYGYIDKDERLVIGYVFDEAGSFFNGRACIRRNGKYGYINAEGKVVIPCIYDEFASFKNGFANVKIGDRLMKISITGEVFKQVYTDDRY